MDLLGRGIAAVRGVLQRGAQRALGIAAAELLAHVLAQGAHVLLGDGVEGGVERRRVEVGRGVRVQKVDVDGAPVVAQRGVADLLDDGHFGGVEEEG